MSSDAVAIPLSKRARKHQLEQREVSFLCNVLVPLFDMEFFKSVFLNKERYKKKLIANSLNNLWQDNLDALYDIAANS